MFKSLIQPLQLFLKGATGKDRHQKQQLTQQLMRLQVAYDQLQESCDTIQSEHDQVQRERNQLQKEYDRLRRDRELLQRDRNELNTLFNCADKENIELDGENRKLRSQIKKLKADNVALEGKIVYLEHKLGLQDYIDDGFTGGQLEAASVKRTVELKYLANEPDDYSDFDSAASIDLSNITLALVGGHETTYREVAEALKKHGLKRCVHVPPHSRESNSRHQIRDKISNCDLVVTITSYVDHSVSNCVKQLKDTSMLSGEVIRVHCHGKSGVVREVLQYFSA